MTDAQFDRITALLTEIREALEKMVEMEEERRSNDG